MKRLVGIAGAVLIALVVLAPVALAADPSLQTGRVLVSTEGDFTLVSSSHGRSGSLLG